MSPKTRRVIAVVGIAFWLIVLVPRFVAAFTESDSPLGDRLWLGVFQLLILILLFLPYLVLLRELRTEVAAWAVATGLLASHITLGTWSILERDPLGGGFLLFYAVLAGVGITLVGGGIDRLNRKPKPQP